MLKDTGFVLPSWMFEIEAIIPKFSKIDDGTLSVWQPHIDCPFLTTDRLFLTEPLQISRGRIPLPLVKITPPWR